MLPDRLPDYGKRCDEAKKRRFENEIAIIAITCQRVGYKKFYPIKSKQCQFTDCVTMIPLFSRRFHVSYGTLVMYNVQHYQMIASQLINWFSF